MFFMRRSMIIYWSIFLLCCCPAFAQKEAANWYFGNKAGVSFNNTAPVALLDGQLITNEGCAAISNGDGALQFYTDGTTVYNKNHAIMQNGTGLLGNVSSTQSAMIIPAPTNAGKYYIFTVAHEGTVAGLNYSEVDMLLDGGMGAITAKNIRLDPGYRTAEKITAVRHADGQQIWIITHRMDSDKFTSFLVSSTGVDQTPVVSAAGQFTGAGAAVAIGYLKASPNGKKLASAKQNIAPSIELFDFDSSTGIVSNPLLLSRDGGYGIEFSPDSKRLYYSIFSSDIYQFDLSIPDPNSIINSRTLIATGTFAALQLALDGKIYATKNGTPNGLTLSVINAPNNAGTACNFQLTGISLAGRSSTLGLPPFIQTFFQQEIKATQFCAELPTQFSISINATITGANWNFGDGMTSAGINPSHTYLTPGTYYTSVDFTIDTNSDVIHLEKEIKVLAAPQAFAASDMVACITTADPTTFVLSLKDDAILNGQNPNDYQVSYYESITDLNNGNAITTLTHSADFKIVFSKVTNRTTGCFDLTSFKTVRANTPIISGKKDLLGCASGLTSASFNLSQNDSLIMGSQNSGIYKVLYFSNVALAEAGVAGTEIVSPSGYNSGNGAVYARIFNINYPQCYSVANFNLTVVQEPKLNQNVKLKFCEPNSSGYHTFTFSDYYSQISPDPDISIYSFDFYFDQTAVDSGLALPDSYTNEIISNQSVIVIVTNNLTGCKSKNIITLLVESQPVANPVTSIFKKCDDSGGNDGIAYSDISPATLQVLGSQSAADHLVTFYRTSANASAGIDPVDDLTHYQNTNPFNDTVWVRIENTIVSGCPSFTSFEVFIDPLPKPVLSPATICIDYITGDTLRKPILNSGLDVTHHCIWYRDGQAVAAEYGPTLEASEPGDYYLMATAANGCSERSNTVAVSVSGPATFIGTGYTITNAFEENQAITIFVKGYGQYVYRLDDGPWQSDNVFSNVTPGLHNVKVKDISTADPCDGEGLDLGLEDIKIFTFPKFFTPNNDGYNDLWNIFSFTEEQPAALIFIYDRFGKLLKQIAPGGPGWDGIYDGKPLPSSDYWFTMIYKINNNNTVETKQISSHFSLKR